MNQANIPIERLAISIPNKASLYRILVKDLGYFLPEETSKAINEAYLLFVLRGEVFTLSFQKKRNYLLNMTSLLRNQN